MQVCLFMDSEELRKSGQKKSVISISIGSSKRDAKGSLFLGDTEVALERKGTDGDIKEAARLLKVYDGKVDAMGLGGTDLYLVAGNRRYVFAESEKLVKQLLNKTYDIPLPEVVAVYMTGKPVPGVGPQDVALAIIGAVFEKGYVKNKVMERASPIPQTSRITSAR